MKELITFSAASQAVEKISQGWALTRIGWQWPPLEARLNRCLGQPPELSQVRLCHSWLRLHALPRRSLNRKVSSYCLKHLVEDWLREIGKPKYVSNGAFIHAALSAGFRFKIDTMQDPNCYFAIGLYIRTLPCGKMKALPVAEWPERHLLGRAPLVRA